MKSDISSAERRKIGNDFYKSKDHERALDFYQQALVLASSREHKALCYGNISAVYAAVKDAKSSILNIAVARKFHTPDGSEKDIFLEKLARREKECNEMDSSPFVNVLKLSVDIFFLPLQRERGLDPQLESNMSVKAFPIGLPLSYPSNAKVPGLVDRVGRAAKTLYAMKDMRFGDVIAVTKSIGSAYRDLSKNLESSTPLLLNKHFCSNCGITQFSVIITCDRCISRFCSVSCKETSLKESHNFDCRLFLDRAELLFVEHYFLITLKMAFKYSAVGLKVPSRPTTCFDWNDGGESLKDEFAAITGFQSIVTTSNIFKYDPISMMKKFLEGFDPYKNIKDKDSFWKIFKILLPKVAENLIDSTSLGDLETNVYYKGVIVNIDWLHGLFEHSCKPNVMVYRSPHLNENYYVLLEDVKSGENLSIAYKNLDYLYPLIARKLYFGHSFKCSCIACRNNIMADRIEVCDYAIILCGLNISAKNVNSQKKLEKWLKAQLQEVLTVSQHESHSKRLLLFLLNYLFPYKDLVKLNVELLQERNLNMDALAKLTFGDG